MQTPELIKQPSQKDVESAILSAYETIKNTTNKAASSDVTQSVANTLTKYSNAIQSVLNSFLQKRGAITQQQLDELDEKIREAKKKTLEAESRNTLVRYGLYLSIGVVAFGALWMITREKK